MTYRRDKVLKNVFFELPIFCNLIFGFFILFFFPFLCVGKPNFIPNLFKKTHTFFQPTFFLNETLSKDWIHPLTRRLSLGKSSKECGLQLWAMSIYLHDFKIKILWEQPRNLRQLSIIRIQIRIVGMYLLNSFMKVSSLKERPNHQNYKSSGATYFDIRDSLSSFIMY